MNEIKIYERKSSLVENEQGANQTYSFEEYVELRSENKWTGGYVQTLGYVPEMLDNSPSSSMPNGSNPNLWPSSVYPCYSDRGSGVLKYRNVASTEGNDIDIVCGYEYDCSITPHPDAIFFNLKILNAVPDEFYDEEPQSPSFSANIQIDVVDPWHPLPYHIDLVPDNCPDGELYNGYCNERLPSCIRVTQMSVNVFYQHQGQCSSFNIYKKFFDEQD